MPFGLRLRISSLPVIIGVAAGVAGGAAAALYAHAGLSLSHYDARAHLVVARRILDSLTPGWMQIGAVWLPLPHMLNMLPVQIDALYRTGASAVAMSVASTALGAWALSSLIVRVTGSAVAAIAAAALLVINPNVLYLQSTPMTEPMLFGTSLLCVALTAAWIDDGASEWPHAAGCAAIAACLTRYEAWPIVAVLIVLTCAVSIRRGTPPQSAVVACARLAAYPLGAVLIFLANSRWTVGAWFVSSGFFVPENLAALGHPAVAGSQVLDGVFRVSGTVVVWSAYGGAALIAAAFLRSPARASLMLVLALAAAAALPWGAYLQGHPFRIRYEVPLIVAGAAIAGCGIGVLRSWLRPLAAAAVVGGAVLQAHPFDRRAPMIVEAQRDASNMAGRRTVTAYLVAHRDNRTILMSMGSLGHYMHDLSSDGFAIHDFLHEGNGELWTFAMLRPAGIVGWIAIEEHAEGGDAVFREVQRNARFLDGFVRVAEGGGVALYRSTGFR